MRKTFNLISKIADRAKALDTSLSRDKLDWAMDIDAVHESIGLDLEKLIGADDFNFAHDVFGIARHLNRETKELENHFLPRCVAKG